MTIPGARKASRPPTNGRKSHDKQEQSSPADVYLPDDAILSEADVGARGPDVLGQDIEEMDLSNLPDDRRDGAKGLATREAGPPADHTRTVALRLLHIFGACLLLIIGLTATTAFTQQQETLKDLIGFFGTVVATLGTLLGGVVAFYFTRR